MDDDKRGKACLLIHKRTGETLARYPSIKQAAIETGWSQNKVRRQVLHHFLPVGDTFLRFEEEWKGSEIFTSAKNRPVVLAIGERKYWFGCAVQAAKAIYIHPSSIYMAISKGKRAGIFKPSYVSATGWEER